MKKIILLALFAAMSGVAVGQTRGRNLHETPLLRMALNYYSFNTPLTRGTETVESVIDFAADAGFDAVDITGYYMPGYPDVPSDDYLLGIKSHAFHQGMTICGTGVRNDFTLADPAALEKEKRLVKEWVVAASKLGASTLRVFAGAGTPTGDTREATARRIAAALDECAEFARPYGVVIALQNHFDFLKTAEDVKMLFSLIASDNVGLMLDIGSYRTDPYREIEQTIEYAVSWQIKEKVFEDRFEGGIETDMERIMGILTRHAYRGFVPIEILGAGRERERANEMLEKMRAARATIDIN